MIKKLFSKTSSIQKPLLVTGSHRSGSTWIGKVLESSNAFLYLDEPTSLNDIPNSLPEIQYWFQHIRSSDHYLIKQLQSLNNDALRRHKRALFKDPLAFFSIDIFIQKLQADILISIRHPAAFVSSLKRLGWSHDFNHFLQQPELMETYLYPFRQEIENHARKEYDIIDQGILLWNIIYLTALKYKQKYPQIYLVRHEDLSLEPITEFKKMFAHFNIPFTTNTQQYITDTTNEKNSIEAKNNAVHQLHRNAKANIYNFQKRLTHNEIKRIRQGTQLVAHIFYDNDLWIGTNQQ
jgi:hypothetical protein